MRRIEHIFMVRCWRLILRQHRKILKCIFEIYMSQQRNMLGRKILNNSKLIRFSEISLRSYNFSTIRNCLIGKNVSFTFTKFTILYSLCDHENWWVVEVWMSKVWGFIYVLCNIFYAQYSHFLLWEWWDFNLVALLIRPRYFVLFISKLVDISY